MNKQAPTCDPGDHPKHGRARLVSDDALERAARIFRALGEESRLRIVAVLAQGEACVTELARTSDESPSTVSQRLRLLRAENIVCAGVRANTSTTCSPTSTSPSLFSTHWRTPANSRRGAGPHEPMIYSKEHPSCRTIIEFTKDTRTFTAPAAAM